MARVTMTRSATLGSSPRRGREVDRNWIDGPSSGEIGWKSLIKVYSMQVRRDCDRFSFPSFPRSTRMTTVDYSIVQMRVENDCFDCVDFQ
jgi:hypothetical protein